MLQELLNIPDKVEQILARDEEIEAVAGVLFKARDFIYLGRGIQYPIALEGALKLKEITYIHAEGYPAGEMKHGPIALIDEDLPVVLLAPRDGLREKILSNLQEVKSRGGKVVSLFTSGDTEMEDLSDHSIPVPASNAYLTPILMTIPLQLIAYHIGVMRGCDVDQPRNLAKSVTVE
jgi:glucosamine--fructose-6-phosphate aminotransferase (isomerizing)